MRAVRLGSYSMCATLAGTPSLSARLKSITRYARLWPPPWCRVVIRPWTLRPPFLGSGRTSDFSGSVRVTSTKSATLEPRRPGVVGLYLRMPIFFVHPLSVFGRFADQDRPSVVPEVRRSRLRAPSRERYATEER